MAAGHVAPLEPTADERTMAILAHVLQIVGWWIAPLIIFLIKRESKFVSFHALQALFLQILYILLWGIIMVVWFAAIFAMIAHAPAAKNAPPPLGIFVLMPLIWLGAMGLWAVVLVVAIVYGIKAGRGEWAEYLCWVGGLERCSNWVSAEPRSHSPLLVPLRRGYSREDCYK